MSNHAAVDRNTHLVCRPGQELVTQLARGAVIFFSFQGWEADTGVTKGTLGVHSSCGQAEKGDILAGVDYGHGVHWALAGFSLCGVPVVCCPHYVVWAG